MKEELNTEQTTSLSIRWIFRTTETAFDPAVIPIGRLVDRLKESVCGADPVNVRAMRRPPTAFPFGGAVELALMICVEKSTTRTPVRLAGMLQVSDPSYDTCATPDFETPNPKVRTKNGLAIPFAKLKQGFVPHPD